MLLRRRRRPRPQSPYVTVLETGDKAAIALARVCLDSADVKHWVRDDLVQDFFGLGTLGTACNYVTGPARVVVNREDAEVAVELLSGMERSGQRYRHVVRVYAILDLAATAFGLIRSLWR